MVTDVKLFAGPSAHPGYALLSHNIAYMYFIV